MTFISIHAPSRERRSGGCARRGQRTFQSTLPRGSDQEAYEQNILILHFNPRSLAGATLDSLYLDLSTKISIHAPSRERL